MQNPPTRGSDSPEPSKGVWKVGTITYTTGGVVVLFLWLLWGGLCMVHEGSLGGGTRKLVFEQPEDSEFCFRDLDEFVPRRGVLAAWSNHQYEIGSPSGKTRAQNPLPLTHDASGGFGYDRPWHHPIYSQVDTQHHPSGDSNRRLAASFFQGLVPRHECSWPLGQRNDRCFGVFRCFLGRL